MLYSPGHAMAMEKHHLIQSRGMVVRSRYKTVLRTYSSSLPFTTTSPQHTTNPVLQVKPIMHAFTLTSSLILGAGLLAQTTTATVAYGKSSANEPSEAPHLSEYIPDCSLTIPLSKSPGSRASPNAKTRASRARARIRAKSASRSPTASPTSFGAAAATGSRSSTTTARSIP
jgi:hypothetical protein